jgi:hypothetical protein
MSDLTNMWRQLRSHRILLDSCLDLQPESPEFLNAFESTFRRNSPSLPTVLLCEPTNPSLNAELSGTAQRAIEQIIQSYFKTCEETALQKCDDLQNQVILRVAFQHQQRRKIGRLANDCNLLRGLPQIWKNQSCGDRHGLEVLKLNDNGFTNRRFQ